MGLDIDKFIWHCWACNSIITQFNPNRQLECPECHRYRSVHQESIDDQCVYKVDIIGISINTPINRSRILDI